MKHKMTEGKLKMVFLVFWRDWIPKCHSIFNH